MYMTKQIDWFPNQFKVDFLVAFYSLFLVAELHILTHFMNSFLLVVTHSFAQDFCKSQLQFCDQEGRVFDIVVRFLTLKSLLREVI